MVASPQSDDDIDLDDSANWEPFEWSPQFATGDDEFDAQHQHLLDLINAYGKEVAEGLSDEQKTTQLLDTLIDYTIYHFKSEEAQMRAVGVDSRHLQMHFSEHQRLANDVRMIRASVGTEAELSPSQVFAFLANWLGFHVLGIDQSLARQMQSIRSGLSSVEAYELEEKRDGGPVQPLLDAVTTLLTIVRNRNQELHDLNAQLELKVAQRTSELETLSQRMEMFAKHDQLTGLPNRRFLMQELEELWHSPEPLSLMMIDCDNFKRVNDQFGHAAGDALLKQVSKVLRSSARADDTVVRLGGDEFLLLCPRTPLREALTLAESLRQDMSGRRLSVVGGCWQGSLSIGVAERTDRTTSISALLRLADNSLYAAKDAGRNAVRSTQAES